MRASYLLAAGILGALSWTADTSSEFHVDVVRRGTAGEVLLTLLPIVSFLELPVCWLGLGWFVKCRRERVACMVSFALVRTALLMLYKTATSPDWEGFSTLAAAWAVVVLGGLYTFGGLQVSEFAARFRQGYEGEDYEPSQPSTMTRLDVSKQPSKI